jgi:hypothetical protein
MLINLAKGRPILRSSGLQVYNQLPSTIANYYFDSLDLGQYTCGGPFASQMISFGKKWQGWPTVLEGVGSKFRPTPSERQ